MARPRIVVVGGGFGGLYASAYLAGADIGRDGADVVLIDRKNHFTFTPLLAEVVAGSLGREHVTYSYWTLAGHHGFRFVHAAAGEVDLERRTVLTEAAEYPYDYLILAVGAAPRYFGNDNLRTGSLPFVTVDDALAAKARVMTRLERATHRDGDPAGCGLTFVVAGAGPAGVEVASEIHHLASQVARYHLTGLPPLRVIIATAGHRILEGFDAELAKRGEDVLRRRGIDVRLGTRIQDRIGTSVRLEGAGGVEDVQADTLIWTAGTAPSDWLSTLELPLERGALPVDRYLRVGGRADVFAVGDAILLVDERTGQPYPRVAPIAISQGIRAAGNIENLICGRALEPYHAHHAGKIVSLGGGVALVDLLGFRLTGRLAWWTYRGAYLLKLVGTKNKIRVLVTLGLNRLFEPDLTYPEGNCR